MRFLVVGAGGIGAYYGARLLQAGNEVVFVARGEHLDAIKKRGLSVKHPSFVFDELVVAMALSEYDKDKQPIDCILLTTKATSTRAISQELHNILGENIPYILSLQNGVENEDILCEFFPKEKIIGGICRKIGGHITKPSCIEATGNVETLIGAIKRGSPTNQFIQKLCFVFQSSGILCDITQDIKKELYKKLIINNGVNAICALLQIKTQTLMNHEKLNKIVYGLMNETALAAKVAGVEMAREDIDAMFELIKTFDSIKPSMLIDREYGRTLEIEEICGIVIRNNESQNIDSPYTKTISTLLEYTYKEKQ